MHCICYALAYALLCYARSLQSCPTLCDPIDGSPPGFPIPGILQARTMEWVAISFSNAWKWKVKVKSLSHVRPSATPWTAPSRLLHPWDFPGKSSGVGCHCLLHLRGYVRSFLLYWTSHTCYQIFLRKRWDLMDISQEAWEGRGDRRKGTCERKSPRFSPSSFTPYKCPLPACEMSGSDHGKPWSLSRTELWPQAPGAEWAAQDHEAQEQLETDISTQGSGRSSAHQGLCLIWSFYIWR